MAVRLPAQLLTVMPARPSVWELGFHGGRSERVPCRGLIYIGCVDTVASTVGVLKHTGKTRDLIALFVGRLRFCGMRGKNQAW